MTDTDGRRKVLKESRDANDLMRLYIVGCVLCDGRLPTHPKERSNE